MRSRGGHHGQHDPHYDDSSGGNSFYGNNYNYGAGDGGGGGGGYSPYGSPPPVGNSGGPSAYGSYGGSGGYNNSGYNSNYQDYNNSTIPSYGGGGSNYGGDYGLNDADDSHNKYKKIKKQSMNESIIMHGICLGVMMLLAMYLTFGCYWNTSKQYTQILELDGFSSSSSSRGRKKKHEKPQGPKKLSNLVDKFNELKQRREELDDEIEHIDTGGLQEVSAQQDQLTKINDLMRQEEQLKRERDELKKKHEGPEKKEAEARTSQRQRAYQQRVQTLVAATRRESKRAVLERFGPGPHQVELLFPIPGNGVGDNGGGSGVVETNKTFTVLLELAPLTATPHAIHLFLEQIEHGLWNKEQVHVYLNTDHVLQIGPKIVKEEEEVENDDEYVRSSQIPFQEADLDTLAFPDYSDEYPHEEWTIGFAGRPGGPDIYINKLDNNEIHGPGGQLHHALAEEQGDSCFGKVLKGQIEIQQYLYSLPTMTAEDWEDYVIDPVPIIEAKIVSERPKKGDEVIVDMDASTSVWSTPKDLHRFHEDIVSVVAALDLITSLDVIEDEIVIAALAAAAERDGATEDGGNPTERQVSKNVDYVYGEHPPNANAGSAEVDTDEMVTKNTPYVYGDHPPAAKKGGDDDGSLKGDTEKETKNTQYVYGDHPPVDTAKGEATKKDVPTGGGTSGMGSWY